MKKTVIILVIMTFIIQGFSQKRTNDLFNKKQTSISFSPSFGLSMGKIIYLGANFQLGYNIFKKTEIGISLGGIFAKDLALLSTGVYSKYYIINRRFTPVLELGAVTGTGLSELNFYGDIYSGFGLGYYGIANRVGLELQAQYFFISKGFQPLLTFKWYFKNEK